MTGIIPLGRLINALDPNLPTIEAGQCAGGHCRGTSAAIEPHPCPFDCEINDDHESLCTCCEICQQECADDI